MRKLIVAEHISLDGVMQAPGGPEEDPSGQFTLGGWSAPYADESDEPFLGELFAQDYELLLGRRTYDVWTGYWPKVKPDHPAAAIAEKFNATAKHVATHRADSLTWKNSHALKGAVADAVRTLKQTAGPTLHTWGSSELVRELMAAGLVDELWLMIYPVVLGPGKRLFGANALPSSFTMARSAITKTGVVLARYVRGGAVRTGSYD